MVSAGGMIILNVPLAANWGLEASVTVMKKKGVVAGAVGVPLITPVLVFRLSPAGSVPNVSAHVYGAVPPVATMGCEYAVCIAPPGNVLVVMISGGVIVIFRALLVVNCGLELSLTVTLKLGASAVVGVPIISPVSESRLSPAGSAPADRDQV